MPPKIVDCQLHDWCITDVSNMLQDLLIVTEKGKPFNGFIEIIDQWYRIRFLAACSRSCGGQQYMRHLSAKVSGMSSQNRAKYFTARSITIKNAVIA